MATLRRLNTRSLLRGMTNEPDREFTVTELSDLTQLSRPTVSSALADLVEEGWVTPAFGDEPTRGAGRPARRFRFERTAGVGIGVDAGPHSTTVLVADLAGDIVVSRRTEFDDLSDPVVAVDAIDSAIQRALGDLSSVPPVYGLSVAVPGVVDPEGRLRQSTVVPEWVGADIVGELSRRYPRAAVALGNDVKLATVAELRAGSSRSSHFVYLSVGRRISAGIVMGGSLQIGATGAAGELGASHAIRWAGAVESAIKNDERSLGALARDARDGEATAVAIIEEIAGSIGEGLALLALAVDPELVVLAGPAAQAGDVLARPLRAALAAVSLDPPELAFAAVDVEPSARGAVEESLAAFRRTGPLAEPSVPS
nr:ROK family transcriptional regulator [Mycetocola zhadangensis]